MFDDSKSDNTDDLLTSIEPMLLQSDYLLHPRLNKLKLHNISEYPEKFSKLKGDSSKVILDDILSGRSNDSTAEIVSKDRLSKLNLKYANELGGDEMSESSDRTISTRQWAVSTTPHSTQRSNDNHEVGLMSKDVLLEKVYELNKELEKTRSYLNSARIECQRVQLTNKQLATQLKESKLSIQTLSVQLEQTQKECYHKESTLENLDSTIGKLVFDWKKRQSIKDNEIDKLNELLLSRNKSLEESRELLEKTKAELANSVRSLSSEKSHSDQVQKNSSVELDKFQRENSKLIFDKSNLEKDLKQMKEDMRKLKEHIGNISKENSIKDTEKFEESRKKIANLIQELDACKRDNYELEQELESQNQRMIRAKEEIISWEDEANKWRREVQDKEDELSRLRIRISEMETNSESSFRCLEKDLRTKHEEEIKSTLEKGDLKMKKLGQNYAFQLQQKLSDQSQKHKLEMERLRQVVEKEIESRLSDSEETIKILRERLSRSEKSVAFWQKEKESVERARNQLSATLFQSVSGRNTEYLPEASVQQSKSDQLETLHKPDISPVSIKTPNFTAHDNTESFQPINKPYDSYFQPIKEDKNPDVPKLDLNTHNTHTTINNNPNGNYHTTISKTSLATSSNGLTRSAVNTAKTFSPRYYSLSHK